MHVYCTCVLTPGYPAHLRCPHEFLLTPEREELHGRFKLKGKDACKGVFINEDLTSVRYSILMAAKKREGRVDK